MPCISENVVDQDLSRHLFVPHVPPSWAQKVGGPYQQSSEMHGVQSADEYQLHIKTATTPELFQGIDPAERGSI